MNTTTFGGVRITCFGHASVMLEYGDKNIYIDPYVLPPNPKLAHLILHTHNHFDHCVLPKSITGQNTQILGHGCKHPGQSVEIGQTINAGAISIQVVAAYNTNKPNHPKGAGAGYILTFGPASKPLARIYVAGDTDRIPEMSSYRCDVAIVPIGGTYTMDIVEAAQAISDIKPKIAIPYHYNYLSELKADPLLFKQKVDEMIKGVDVRILIP